MKVLVGVDGGERALDAVRLGARLAAVEGGELVVAHVHPRDPTYGFEPRFARDLRRRAERLLERLHGELPDLQFEDRVVEESSIPRGLLALVAEESADLLVVASSHRGPIGRVVPGSIGERLLHGAPCPLAVAPVGFRSWGDRPSRIVVGYDGSAEAREALRLAERVAAAGEARVHLVAVVDTDWAGDLVGEDADAHAEVREVLAGRLRERLAGGVESLGRRVEADTEVRFGDPGRELLAAAAGGDLLVIGSRGYGPLGHVLLGSTAVSILRHAAVPVVVLPRHAGQEAQARETETTAREVTA